MAQRITTISVHKQFKKHYKIRIAPRLALVKQFEKRYTLFIANREHRLLGDHALAGELQGYRAFSITRDIRVVYRLINETTVLMVDIGTHNQVY
jgi:addiction module RelE/StbE family toxin